MSGQKFWDCDIRFPEPGSELIIAEGDSAAGAVVPSRDARWQAVLAVQGKPLNAARATAARVEKNVQLTAVRDAIGVALGNDVDIEARSYERVILLFDPDADGIHSRALMLLFFYTCMHPLLEAGVVYTARPPLWELTIRPSPERKPIATTQFAFTDQQYDELTTSLARRGHFIASRERFRGLASMSHDTLHHTCLNPETRTLSPLTVEHAEAVLAAYENIRPA